MRNSVVVHLRLCEWKLDWIRCSERFAHLYTGPASTHPGLQDQSTDVFVRSRMATTRPRRFSLRTEKQPAAVVSEVALEQKR